MAVYWQLPVHGETQDACTPKGEVCGGLEHGRTWRVCLVGHKQVPGWRPLGGGH
jgi:hypothetical protein